MTEHTDEQLDDTVIDVWTVTDPDADQVIEVVTVVAEGDPDTTNSPDTTQENP